MCDQVPMPSPFRTVHDCKLSPHRPDGLDSENSEVMDGIESGCVIRSPCILLSGQCTIVHCLRIGETTLIPIESPKVIDDVKSGCVVRSPCLLVSGQCTIVHSLCIGISIPTFRMIINTMSKRLHAQARTFEFLSGYIHSRKRAKTIPVSFSSGKKS
jgi:hypothetical protein